MKNWIISVCLMVLIAGCSSRPETLQPHPEKYTFQVIGLEIPETVFLELAADTKALMHHPDARITEYPVLIAGLGESVTNDRTRTVLLPEDYTVVDGKAVASEKEYSLGYLVSVTAQDVENDIVSYHLNARYQDVAGYDTIRVTEDLKVEMPYLNTRSIDTEIRQKPNTWVMLGGIVNEQVDGRKMSYMLGVRIIPPLAAASVPAP